MTEHKLIQHSDDGNKPEASSENVFRRGIVETPHEKELTQHRLWLASIQHEYPMPYIPYKIGVYIRFYNQTQYSDEVYLSKHKQWFIDDISLCPKWTLVDFYIDNAPKVSASVDDTDHCHIHSFLVCGVKNHEIVHSNFAHSHVFPWLPIHQFISAGHEIQRTDSFIDAMNLLGGSFRCA